LPAELDQIARLVGQQGLLQKAPPTPGAPAAHLLAHPQGYLEIPPSVLFGEEGEPKDAYDYAHRPK
jgi:hypothetical protein